jgi:phospholipid/cholesterol/gamma-HCH transport system substrate-binding protein
MRTSGVSYVMVGGFVLAAIVGLVVSVALLTGRTGATDTYYTVYDNVTGVQFGTRVMFEGFPIGQVESIDPIQEGGHVRFRVEMSVREGWRIPADSVAEITASGLLAAVTINLHAGESATMLKPGAQIRGRELANLFAAVSSIASEIGNLTDSNIKPLLENLNQTVVAFGDLVRTDGTALVKDMRGLTGAVSKEVPAIVGDLQAFTDQLSTETPKIIANLDQFSEKLNASADGLNEILNEKNRRKIDQVFANLEAATENMNQLSKDIHKTRSNVDKLVKDLDTTVTDNRADIDRSVDEARHVIESISSHIDAINQNLEGASRNMYEFSRQIRQNPGLLLGGKPARDEAPR